MINLMVYELVVLTCQTEYVYSHKMLHKLMLGYALLIFSVVSYHNPVVLVCMHTQYGDENALYSPYSSSKQLCLSYTFMSFFYSLKGIRNTTVRRHCYTWFFQSWIASYSGVIIWSPHLPCPLGSQPMECITWRLVRAWRCYLVCPWHWIHLHYYMEAYIQFLCNKQINFTLASISQQQQSFSTFLWTYCNFGPRFQDYYLYISQYVACLVIQLLKKIDHIYSYCNYNSANQL